MFRGEKGTVLRRRNFGRRTKWPAMVVAVVVPAGFISTTSDTRATTWRGFGRDSTGADASDGSRVDMSGVDLPARHNARDRSIADAMSALVESGRKEARESSDNGANQDRQDGDDSPAEAMVPVA